MCGEFDNIFKTGVVSFFFKYGEEEFIHHKGCYLKKINQKQVNFS